MRIPRIRTSFGLGVALCALVMVGSAPALAGLAAPVPTGPCGQEFHNFPRVLTMSWSAVPGATGYNVQVDCMHCKVVGKWDSETPSGAANLNVPTPSATFTFPGDNLGQWRVRATVTATAPQMSAIQAGPWSEWCKFSFKTGGVLGPPPQAMPDIVSKKGIIIGGAVGGAGGKFVPWGGSVTLTEADALHGSPNSECAFNLSDDMENAQPVPTGPVKFANRIKVDGVEKSKQSMLSLAANEARQVNTQAYLPIGSHGLRLFLDDDHNVTEMPPNGETNNAPPAVKYVLQGKCYQPYKPR